MLTVPETQIYSVGIENSANMQQNSLRHFNLRAIWSCSLHIHKELKRSLTAVLAHITIYSFQWNIGRSFLEIIAIRFWINFLKWVMRRLNMLQKGSLAVGDSRAYGILPHRKSLWFKYSSLKDVCTEKKGAMCYRIWRK